MCLYLLKFFFVLLLKIVQSHTNNRINNYQYIYVTWLISLLITNYNIILSKVDKSINSIDPRFDWNKIIISIRKRVSKWRLFARLFVLFFFWEVETGLVTWHSQEQIMQGLIILLLHWGNFYTLKIYHTCNWD